MRFDSIARFLASGRSRRDVVKTMLGLGTGLVATGAIGSAEAARRPAPPPKAPTCPGQQVWSNGACVCPAGDKCGPDCCPAEAQCCDNACCYGTCYGEELCCDSPREWCEISGECCADGWKCCPDAGCIPLGECCTNDDCPNDDCAIGVCTENRTCTTIFDCTVGDSCCDGDGICLPNGSCHQVTLAPSYTYLATYDGIRYCAIWANLSGFNSSTDYYIEGLQYFNGSIYQTIGGTVSTDTSGNAQMYMGAVVSNGYGTVALRYSSITSAQVAVSC